MPWPLCFCNLHESFWPKWTKGKVSTLSKFYNWQWQMAVLFAPHSHDSKDTAASATRHRDHQDAQHEKPTALKRSVDRGFGCIPKYVDVEHVWPVGGIWNSEMNTKWQNAYKIRKVEGPSTASSLAPDLFHIDSRNLRKKAFWDQRSNPFLQDRQSYIMCVCVCLCVLLLFHSPCRVPINWCTEAATLYFFLGKPCCTSDSHLDNSSIWDIHKVYWIAFRAF